MAMFVMEISFLFSLAVFAAGLVLWHQGRQGTADLVRGAGVVLVVGSVLTAACTVYFSVRYHVQGEFDHAYAPQACGREAGMMGGAMGSGMMGAGSAQGGPRGMGPDMMRPGMMQPRMQTMPMHPEQPGQPPATESSRSAEQPSPRP